MSESAADAVLESWRSEVSLRNKLQMADTLKALSGDAHSFVTFAKLCDEPIGSRWLREDSGVASGALQQIADAMLHLQIIDRSIGNWYLGFALLICSSRFDLNAVCSSTLVCCLQCINGPGRTMSRYLVASTIVSLLLREHLQRTHENAAWLTFLHAFLSVHISSEFITEDWYARELDSWGDQDQAGRRREAYSEVLDYMRGSSVARLFNDL